MYQLLLFIFQFIIISGLLFILINIFNFLFRRRNYIRSIYMRQKNHKFRLLKPAYCNCYYIQIKVLFFWYYIRFHHRNRKYLLFELSLWKKDHQTYYRIDVNYNQQELQLAMREIDNNIICRPLKLKILINH